MSILHIFFAKKSQSAINSKFLELRGGGGEGGSDPPNNPPPPLNLRLIARYINEQCMVLLGLEFMVALSDNVVKITV